MKKLKQIYKEDILKEDKYPYGVDASTVDDQKVNNAFLKSLEILRKYIYNNKKVGLNEDELLVFNDKLTKWLK